MAERWTHPSEPWPRAGDTSPTVGLQCWGCGNKQRRVGTHPTRWIETMCNDPECLGVRIAEGSRRG